MTPLCIEGVEVLCLRATLLGKGSVLSLGGLKLRLSSNNIDICLLLEVHDLSLCLGSSSVYDLHYPGLYLTLGSVLLTSHLCDQHVTDLLSLDYRDFLVSLSAHPKLVLLHLSSIDL